MAKGRPGALGQSLPAAPRGRQFRYGKRAARAAPHRRQGHRSLLILATAARRPSASITCRAWSSPKPARAIAARSFCRRAARSAGSRQGPRRRRRAKAQAAWSSASSPSPASRSISSRGAPLDEPCGDRARRGPRRHAPRPGAVDYQPRVSPRRWRPPGRAVVAGCAAAAPRARQDRARGRGAGAAPRPRRRGVLGRIVVASPAISRPRFPRGGRNTV